MIINIKKYKSSTDHVLSRCVMFNRSPADQRKEDGQYLQNQYLQSQVPNNTKYFKKKILTKAPFRKNSVDMDRELDFDLDRVLDIRLKGVRFRKRGVVFRNRGVIFRRGSIDLDSSLKDTRDQWKDHARWDSGNHTYKRSTIKKKSRLKEEKRLLEEQSMATSKVTRSQVTARRKKPQLDNGKYQHHDDTETESRSYDYQTDWDTGFGSRTEVEPLDDAGGLPGSPGAVPRGKSYKKDAIVLNNYGAEHYKKEDYSTALSFFTAAVQTDPYLEVAKKNQQACLDKLMDE